MRAPLRALALILPCLLLGCERTPDVPPPGNSAMRLDPALLDYYIRESTGSPASQVDTALKGRLRDDLLALQAAAARPTEPEAVPAAELARLRVLAKSAAKAAGVLRPASETDLENAYRAYVASLPKEELEISHILVATEEEAAQILEHLARGEDFADLARVKSADDSKAVGGSLGWMSVDKLPAPLREAVRALQPGQYSPEPVKTQYGWHVVRLDGARAASAPPPMNELRAQIEANLAEQRYRQFLSDSLRQTQRQDPRR